MGSFCRGEGCWRRSDPEVRQGCRLLPSSLTRTFSKHNAHIHAVVNGDSVDVEVQRQMRGQSSVILAMAQKGDAGGMWWEMKSEGEERGIKYRKRLLQSDLFSILFSLLVCSEWRRVTRQNVRGSSVETFRKRGRRDAEIEVCLLTGNPINQLVNISPFPLSSPPLKGALSCSCSGSYLCLYCDMFKYFNVQKALYISHTACAAVPIFTLCLKPEHRLLWLVSLLALLWLVNR